jgi:hypothetical protein
MSLWEAQKFQGYVQVASFINAAIECEKKVNYQFKMKYREVMSISHFHILCALHIIEFFLLFTLTCCKIIIDI